MGERIRFNSKDSVDSRSHSFDSRSGSFDSPYITDLSNCIGYNKTTIYKNKGVKRPKYQGKLPEGNNGLGLFLLGVSGNEVLDSNIYEQIKKHMKPGTNQLRKIFNVFYDTKF